MAKAVRCYHADGTHEDFSSTLTFDKVREYLHGYVEVHHIGLDVLCDEEGKLKGLNPTGRWRGQTLVGDLFVGHLTDAGLLPADEDALHEFELLVINSRP